MSETRDSQTDAILSAVLETTNDMICAVDAESFSLIAFNSALARHFLTKFGKTLQVGMRLEDVFDAEREMVWRNLFRRTIDEGPFSIAHRGLVEGQTLWLSFNRLVKDGRCFGVSSFARDITAFEQAVHSAQSAEDRFAKVFRHNPSPVGITTADHGVFVDVNEALSEWLGHERSSLIGKTAVEVGIWPDFYARARFAKSAQATGRISGFPLSYRHPDGRLLHGLLASDLVRLEGVDCFLVSITDVTSLRVAEQALRDSELRYRALIETAPEAIVLIDADTGRYVDANENACRQSGYDKADLLGRDPSLISPVRQPDGSVSADVLRDTTERAARGETVTLEWLHVMRDGKTIPCEVRLTPFPDSKRRLVRGSIIDISERKRLEKEALALRSQLEQAQRLESLGTLAGGIAHDFNNILCSVIGYAELALLHAQDEQVRSFIEDIERGAIRAKDLVRQILSFSRKAPHQKKPVQVVNVIKEALQLLRAALPSTIVIEQNHQSSGWVMTDPTQIHQIMMNLGTNAGLAMHEKGGVLDVRVTERDIDDSSVIQYPGLKPGRHLCWTVRDSGCGMASQTVGRIFEPFFTTRSQGEGTGLGLSVVYGIVTDASGSIGVTSEVGVGTTFEILLPLCASPDKQEGGAALDGSFVGPRVLLVDDDPALTEVGKATLAPLGLEVTAFTSPAEAMAAFGKHPEQFDVLVTEAQMPAMAGKALALAMRRIRPDLPVILTTGVTPCHGDEEWRAAGVTACLRKPYRPTELAQAIQNACGKRPFTKPRK